MGRPRKQQSQAKPVSKPVQLVSTVPASIVQDKIDEAQLGLQADWSAGALDDTAMDFDSAPLTDPNLTYDTDLSFLDFLGAEYTAIPPLDDETPAYSDPAAEYSAWEAPDFSANIDPNLSLLTPPSEAQRPPPSPPSSYALDSSPPTCSCLATLYLALDSLARLPTTTLPALHKARTATRTAHDALRCTACCPPIQATTTIGPVGFQTMMLLGTLLPVLADAYHRILTLVDAETRRAVVDRRTVTFSLSAYGGMWNSFSTGGGGSTSEEQRRAAAVYENKEMAPGEWRLTVRSLLKMDVYGVSCRNGGCEKWQQIGLRDLVAEMDAKSLARHAEIDALIEAGLPPPVGMAGAPAQHSHVGRAPHCRSVIATAREAVESLHIA